MRLLFIMGLLAGCGSPPAPMPAGLRLKVVGTRPAIDGLVLTSVNTKLEKLTVYGDVPPDPRATMPDTDIDLLGGTAITYDSLAPGLYSLVRFVIDDLKFDGSYHGAPLHGLFEFDETSVALRSADGMEVEPEHTARFTIVADLRTWFSAADLDSAQQTGGEILIDPSHNAALAKAIGTRVPASFTVAHDD